MMAWWPDLNSRSTTSSSQCCTCSRLSSASSITPLPSTSTSAMARLRYSLNFAQFSLFKAIEEGGKWTSHYWALSIMLFVCQLFSHLPTLTCLQQISRVLSWLACEVRWWQKSDDGPVLTAGSRPSISPRSPVMLQLPRPDTGTGHHWPHSLHMTECPHLSSAAFRHAPADTAALSLLSDSAWPLVSDM